MAEKRYYQRDFEELYYIIDSHKISEKEFDEKEMYDGYSAFEDSMTGEEIVDLLNENEQLKQQLNIFEKFLEENDLSIDWDEFCGVDECAFENLDFSCKECIHLKGDVE